jgi:hypothetical protein
MSINDTLRNSGRVMRYHCRPMVVRQSVAEHCWQMMRIYHDVYEELPADVALYILYHDSAEVITGDLPYTAKKLNPELKQAMTLAEQRALQTLKLAIYQPALAVYNKVKLVEYVEMLEVALDELSMGNRYMMDVYDNMVSILSVKMDDPIKQYLREKGLHNGTDFLRTS